MTGDELRPFKIVGKLIGSRHDEDGEIIGEEVMGEVVVYRPQFAELEALVERAVHPPPPS
jgi:hypothetical protein